MTTTTTPPRATFRSTLSALNVTVSVTLLTVVSFVLPNAPLSQAMRICGPLVVAGATAAVQLKGRLSLPARVAVALALGLLIEMLWCTVLAVAGPYVGINDALGATPQRVVLVLLAVVGGGWSALRGRDPVREVLAGATGRIWAWTAILTGASALSLIGLQLTNAGSGPDLSIAMGVVALVFVAAAIALPSGRWLPPRVLLLMGAVLTAAWQVPLRGGWLTGGDLPHEYYTALLASQQGRLPLANYHDAYGAMLSLTTWPDIWHNASGVSYLAVFGVLPEIALALCVLMTWATLRERVGERVAAGLCALFVVAAPDLVSTLPLVSRQCYGLLFLTLAIFAIASDRLEPTSQRVLVAVAVLGTAVTHYSTAFILLAAVLVAALVAMVLGASKQRRALTAKVAAFSILAVAAIDVGFAHANASVTHAISGIARGSGGAIPAAVTGPGIRCTVTGAVLKSAIAAAPTTARLASALTRPTPASTPNAVLDAVIEPSTVVLALLAVASLVALVLLVTRVAARPRDRRAWTLAGLAGVATAALACGALATVAAGRRVLDALGSHATGALKGPTIPSIVDVSRLRADDLSFLVHSMSWARLSPGSCATRLVAFAPPRATGVAWLAPTVNAIYAVVGKGAVVLAVVSVVVCLVAARHDRRYATVAGLGVAAFSAAAAWKLIPAMNAYFGTDRVEIESYLMFAASGAAAMQWLTSLGLARRAARLAPSVRAVAWCTIALAAAVAVAGSMGLANLITPGRPLDAPYSTKGQQVDLATAPADLPAAQWIAGYRATGLVQSDFTALGALGAVGYADRREVVTSVDPVDVDLLSWVFASSTNMHQGRAYGGTTSYKVAFQFPIGFLTQTRPTLYTSTGAVIYGSAGLHT